LNHVISRQLHPLLLILITAGLCLAGACIGMFLSLAVLKVVFQLSLTDVQAVLLNPGQHPEARNALLAYQGLVALGTFIFAPWMLARLQGYRFNEYFSERERLPSITWPLVIALLILFIPAISLLISWNAHMSLPDSLKGVENWMRGKEESLKVLTEYITTFDSIGGFLFGVIVIAVIPAIGEELLFRGVLQKQLQRWLGNPHVAIWASAFIFSAIHVQFYGFFPRMALGALLGYLYYWSGNIWIPILGHFVNNGFIVLMMYLKQRGVIELAIESQEAAPWPAVVASLLISVWLLRFLYLRFQTTADKIKYA
jgi:membrane protease YdiL (CAAX protease family)